MPQVFVAISGAIAAFSGTAVGTFLTTNIFGRLLASVALSALLSATASRPNSAGITTERRATGGTNPLAFPLGLTATAGDEICPPMTHGSAGKVQNAYLTMPIALSDIPGITLSRVAINGEWVTLGAQPVPDTLGYGRPVEGRFAGYAWVKFYDGTQTVADPMLLAKYSTHPERPWSADMVGTGVAYAIMTFRFDRTLFPGEPEVLFELGGIPLYDPRKDSTVGGAGTHRWADPATWQTTLNPKVIEYNILRGITVPTHGVWGGRDIAASDVPLPNWFVAMNECDVVISTQAGNVPQYRAGIEVRVDMLPLDVIAELNKVCTGKTVEAGGYFKTRVGGPGLPVMFITDEDIIVTKPQDYDPTAEGDSRPNGIDAKHPSPNAVWATVSAPSIYNAAYEAQDGDRRVVSLDLPACPYKAQAQRVMRDYIRDARRGRKHAVYLPPDAAILETIDALSWTSARNGYTGKSFELAEVADMPLTMIQQVMLREADPSDYGWAPGTEVDVPVVSTAPQIVPSYAPVVTAAPHTFFDNAGNPRRPGVRINWPGLDQDGVRAVMWEVYLSGGVLVGRGTTSDVAAGFVNVGEGILPATSYQVRVKFVSDRPMGWSGLINVTSPNVGLTVADLDTSAAPAVPAGLALSSVLSGTGTVLTATWTAVAGTNIRYDVRIRQGAGNDVARVAPTNRFTWETLPNTSYTVAVRAVNALGVPSAYSAEVTHTTTRDTVAPAVPTGLVVTAGFEALWLKWTRNTEADLAAYEIFEAATSTPAPVTATVATYSSGADTMAISGLADGVTRHFWIRAVDTSGNKSAWSARVQGTTVALAAADISAIIQAASYAAGLAPPIVVSALPTGVSAVARTAFLTTDQKLYRQAAGTSTWTRSVDGADLVADSVTAGSVAAGAIGAEQLAALSVLVRHLAVGDFTNLILNSDLTNDDGWTFDSGVTLATASSNMTKPGMLRIDNATSSGRWGRFTTDVDAGQQYHMSCEIRCATGPDVFSPRLSVDWLDRTGAIISANGNTPTVYDITTPTAVAAVFTAPALAVKAVWRFGRFDATGTTDIGDAFIGSPMVRRRNGGELIVEGSITADKVTTGEFVTLTAQVKDAIITNAKIVDLSAAKLMAGTALVGTLTVSGTALSTIRNQAADPADVINAASTLIDPGMVRVFGSTTVADWRKGGDETHIDGGMLSANSVSTEKLTVGNRMITVTGVTFEHNDPAVNQVSWTAGTIRYINDAGIVTGTAVSAGSATYTTSRRYIYWAKGASTLSSTTSTITTFDEDNVILASYGGDKDLVTDYGMTIIDGGNIKTQTIDASRLNVTFLSSIAANVGTLTGGVLRSPGFVAGASTGAEINLTDGTAIFNGVVLSRNLVLASGSFTYTGNLTNGQIVNLPFINTGIRIGDGDVWSNSKVALIVAARMVPASATGSPPERAMWRAVAGVPYNSFKWTGRTAWTSAYSFTHAWTVDPGTLVNPPWATGNTQRVLFDTDISQVNFTSLNGPIAISWKVFQVT